MRQPSKISRLQFPWQPVPEGRQRLGCDGRRSDRQVLRPAHQGELLTLQQRQLALSTAPHSQRRHADVSKTQVLPSSGACRRQVCHVCSCVRACVRACVRSVVRSYGRTVVRSYGRSVVCSIVRSFVLYLASIACEHFGSLCKPWI